MAQAGVSIGVFNIAKKENIPIEKAKEQHLSVFTRVGEVEFLGMVKPEDTVFIACDLRFYRFGKFETGGEVYKIVEGEKKIVCTHKSIVGQELKSKEVK